MTIDIIALIISILAFSVAIATYLYNRRILRITRAIESAKEYTRILHDMQVVLDVINAHPRILALITKNTPSISSVFTIDELNIIYKKSELAALESFFNFTSTSIDESALQHIYMVENIAAVQVSKDANSYIDANPTLLRNYFYRKITFLLNDLESFSMNFTSKIAADSMVVFQSLHQTFFRVVQLLYYPISKNNKLNSDKYFTNISKLYREWEMARERKNKRIAVAMRRFDRKVLRSVHGK